jgi:hypothetical protein
MSTRRSWTPDELRELAARYPWNKIEATNVRAALGYCADLIHAADAVIEENRQRLAGMEGKANGN